MAREFVPSEQNTLLYIGVRLCIRSSLFLALYLRSSSKTKGDRYMFVGNGARAKEDIDFFRSHQVEIDIHDRALVAIQGPTASQALETFLGYSLSNLKFMQTATIAMSENKVPVWVMRGGYTGEDGFELSIPAEHAVEIVASLLRQAGVEMAGLAARDTLRLEAGLCLYGNDIDECTTPVEAGLTWTICKFTSARAQ